MIGKASEIKTHISDTRELNQWLAENSDSQIVSMQFSLAWSESGGGFPLVLIIYKEDKPNEH